MPFRHPVPPCGRRAVKRGFYQPDTFPVWQVRHRAQPIALADERVESAVDAATRVAMLRWRVNGDAGSVEPLVHVILEGLQPVALGLVCCEGLAKAVDFVGGLVTTDT